MLGFASSVVDTPALAKYSVFKANSYLKTEEEDTRDLWMLLQRLNAQL